MQESEGAGCKRGSGSPDRPPQPRGKHVEFAESGMMLKRKFDNTAVLAKSKRASVVEKGAFFRGP